MTCSSTQGAGRDKSSPPNACPWQGDPGESMMLVDCVDPLLVLSVLQPLLTHTPLNTHAHGRVTRARA